MVHRDELVACARRDWQAIGRRRLRSWAEQSCATDWIAPLVRSLVADLLVDLSHGLTVAGIP